MTRQKNATPAPAVVTQIPLTHIERNPYNPRAIFDRKPLRTLLESIKKVGVLVPITVYPKNKTATDPKRDQFVLLDGERRWRCAKKLDLEAIPAIIIEQPEEAANILTMFHIHNLRLGWQLMPTALKLRVLMEKFGEKNDRKLADLTKLSVSQVQRCKILLSYPKRFQNMMLVPPGERLKPDFFIELQRIRGPALRKRYSWWTRRGDVKSVDVMLQKYLDGKIKAVTDFRNLAQIYRACLERDKLDLFHKEMERFMDDKNYRIDDIDIPGASYQTIYNEVVRLGRKILMQISVLPPDVISANERVVQTLKKLRTLIDEKLERALVEEQPVVRSE